ncbi:MAG: TlpA family protein disulfide reductase [Candidatus Binatus sp.]
MTVAASIAATLILAVAFATEIPGRPASDLKLAPDLSFSNDSSANFPIEGKNLSAGSIAADQATVIFFGTANCWNTAREAERLVRLYPRYKDKIRFVVVDLRNPSLEQSPLIARYYHGYIPTIAVIDSAGKVLYDRAGETANERGDTSNLQKLLDSAR